MFISELMKPLSLSEDVPSRIYLSKPTFAPLIRLLIFVVNPKPINIFGLRVAYFGSKENFFVEHFDISIADGDLEICMSKAEFDKYRDLLCSYIEITYLNPTKIEDKNKFPFPLNVAVLEPTPE